MIQLNLLPDVKLEYMKAQRAQRLVLTVAILAGLAAIALLLILLTYDGLQKKHLSDLKRDIGTESSQLQNEQDIGTILTVQNQLQSLTGLHNGKPAVSRLFDYLNELTPAQVAITHLTTDFTKQTATITGTADALSSVNQYVDTLKLTSYTTDSNSTAAKAFSNVVMSDFSLSNDSSGGPPADFTVTLSYDQNIFDIQQKVTLSVPNTTTTRLNVGQPTDLFQASTSPSSGGTH